MGQCEEIAFFNIILDKCCDVANSNVTAQLNASPPFSSSGFPWKSGLQPYTLSTATHQVDLIFSLAHLVWLCCSAVRTEFFRKQQAVSAAKQQQQLQVGAPQPGAVQPQQTALARPSGPSAAPSVVVAGEWT